MQAFIDSALKSLVHSWRIAVVVADQTPRTATNISPDLKNPWNNLTMPQRLAIEDAVAAGLWPETVPLSEKPDDVD